MSTNVIALATHPIQYQVPIFRALAADQNIDFTALFLSDHSVKGGKDSGFGRAIKWDIPILEGYQYEFIQNLGMGNEGSGFFSYRTKSITSIFKKLGGEVLIVPGHKVCAYWQGVRAAKVCGMAVLARPESLRGVNRKRSNFKRFIRKVGLKWFYANVDIFCSSGYFSRKDALEYGFSENKIVSSPYSINSELFNNQRSRLERERFSIRNKLGVPREGIVIIFTGKFIDWKNPEIILDAIERLPKSLKEKIFPVLIGDGKNFSQVSSRCSQIFKRKQFLLPGFVNQSELGEYYTAGDIFILPSKRGHESWGLVVNEAMVFGLPCIVSDGVGCRMDLIRCGETGFIFQDGDVETLANRIQDLVMDAELRLRMSAAAQKYIQRYSTEMAVQGIKGAIGLVAKRISL